eukprot:1302205-Prymnesium_polylepis.1
MRAGWARTPVVGIRGGMPQQQPQHRPAERTTAAAACATGRLPSAGRRRQRTTQAGMAPGAGHSESGGWAGTE